MTDLPLTVAELWRERNLSKALRQTEKATASNPSEQENLSENGWIQQLGEDLFVNEAVEILHDLKNLQKRDNETTSARRVAG